MEEVWLQYSAKSMQIDLQIFYMPAKTNNHNANYSCSHICFFVVVVALYIIHVI